MKTENFVVITFDDEKNAIEGSHKLQDLAVRGDIAMGYSIILRKGQDGTIEVLKETTVNGVHTWTGMFIGMWVGIFLGPLGFLISFLAGTAIGAGVGYSKDKSQNNFAIKVKERLDNGKISIVANCDESNPVFLDNAMKEFNGEITRTVATR